MRSKSIRAYSNDSTHPHNLWHQMLIRITLLPICSADSSIAQEEHLATSSVGLWGSTNRTRYWWDCSHRQRLEHYTGLVNRTIHSGRSHGHCPVGNAVGSLPCGLEVWRQFQQSSQLQLMRRWTLVSWKTTRHIWRFRRYWTQIKQMTELILHLGNLLVIQTRHIAETSWA